MTKKLLLWFVLGFVSTAICFELFTRVSAAPDVVAAGEPWRLIDVATGAPTKVSLSGHDILFAHTNLLTDGTTGSTATDYVVIMNANETMDATLTAGRKCIVFAGGSASFRGADANYITADSIIEVQLQAVGHSAKIQMVKGSLYGSGK